MNNDDYELIPLKEIKNLKEHIKKLEKEKADSPAGSIARTLGKLSISLEKLFQIFDVAATEIEHEHLHERNFEEKIEPILQSLKELEKQNQDIAEGMLTLVDVVKRQEHELRRMLGKDRVEIYGTAEHEEIPEIPSLDLPPAPSAPIPAGPAPMGPPGAPPKMEGLGAPPEAPSIPPPMEPPKEPPKEPAKKGLFS